MTKEDLIDRLFKDLPISRWMAEKVVKLVIELKEEIPNKERKDEYSKSNRR